MQFASRIQEQQLVLFANRTYGRAMRAIEIRQHLVTVAYVVLPACRKHGFHDTKLTAAQFATIRLKRFTSGEG